MREEHSIGSPQSALTIVDPHYQNVRTRTAAKRWFELGDRSQRTPLERPERADRQQAQAESDDRHRADYATEARRMMPARRPATSTRHVNSISQLLKVSVQNRSRRVRERVTNLFTHYRFDEDYTSECNRPPDREPGNGPVHRSAPAGAIQKRTDLRQR